MQKVANCSYLHLYDSSFTGWNGTQSIIQRYERLGSRYEAGTKIFQNHSRSRIQKVSFCRIAIRTLDCNLGSTCIAVSFNLFVCVCCRKMLSSAHVLAMDAKNLLDVVDNVRVRYPHINRHCIRQQHFPSQGSLSSHHESSSSGASSNASSLEKPPGASSHPPLEPVINED